MSEKKAKIEKAQKSGTAENLHSNHRERVRRAYIERGDLVGMHDHQILELILFYAIKRRDVNPLAHRLVDRFGSLRNVLRADIKELCTAGLSESTAVLLKLIGDVGVAMDRRDVNEVVIKNTNDALNVCYKLLYRESSESIALICLDAKNRIVKTSLKTDGLSDKVNALPKWIVDAAISSDAPALILAHNHPSGSVWPSARDKETTIMLEKLLAPLEIALYDHVIVTHDACYSMKRDFERFMQDEQQYNDVDQNDDILGAG